MQTCGICLEETTEYISFRDQFEFGEKVLFHNGEIVEGIPSSIIECLRFCTRMKWDSGNINDHFLCANCLLELNATYLFLMKAMTAERRFYSFLENDINFLSKGVGCEDVDSLPQRTSSPLIETSIKDESIINKYEDIAVNIKDPLGNTDHIDPVLPISSFSIATLNENVKSFDSSEYFDSEDDRVIYTFELLNDSAIKTEPQNKEDKQLEVQEICKETSVTHETMESPLCNQSYECTICNSYFNGLNDLSAHNINIHKSNLECKICDLFLHPSEDIAEHIKGFHSETEQGESYWNEVKVNSVVSRRNGLDKQKLKENTMKYTKTKTEKKYTKAKSSTCHICGKHFSINYLRLHMLIHTDKRTWLKCEQCEKSYFSKTALNAHMRIHSGQTIQCLKCGKHFVHQYELNIHMRFHNREYLYECDICKRKFCIKGHLRSHMWSHQGLKLQCEECGKLFTSAKSIKEHSFVHTGMPFPCNYCSKAYPNKQKYKRHLNSIHCRELDDEELKKFPNYNNKPMAFNRKTHTLVQANTIIKEVEVVENNSEIKEK